MRHVDEVSEQDGFRWFLAAVLVAIFLGSLVRLALAPSKIERIVRTQIQNSNIRDNLTFADAGISLADGLFPDLAVILNRVEWRPGKSCGDTAPIRARKVRIPLRITSIFSGHPSAGRVKIDELTVDLDDLKNECGPPKSVAPQVGSTFAKPSGIGNSGLAEMQPGEVWTPEDQQKISAMVRGVLVSRAEIFFEKRMKSVVLEELSASWRGQGDETSLDISTALKFPPATVFGENLPTFTIDGTIRRTEMLAEIRADLNEGTLEANATLRPVVTPGGAKELEADVKLAVRDLPLSVVTPLFSKSGIITGAFQPKFIWLDCMADVHGVFSRLLVENPVTISQCEASGQVGRLSLERATRLPNGSWKPFEVVAEKVEIARVFETFDLQGPSGVFTNFGQITGRILVNSPVAVVADGKLNGAIIRFVGGEGVALQPVSIGHLDAKLANHRWSLRFSDFHPEGGEADLTVLADLDEAGRDAKVDVSLKRLKFNSRVEKAIFTGSVADITGAANFATTFLSATGQSVLSRLKAALVIKGMQGAEVDANEVRIEAQLARPANSEQLKPDKSSVKPEVELNAKATSIEVLKTGRLFKLLQPALLGWTGDIARDGERLVLGKVTVKGRFRENGFQWTQAGANVGPTVTLASKGHVYRDHAIDSDLEAHYPLASRLKWSIQGTWFKPKFAAASPELGALFVKAGLPRDTVNGVVPPRLLGVATKTSGGGNNAASDSSQDSEPHPEVSPQSTEN